MSEPFHSNSAFDIVAMAASAGGLAALRQVLTGLPGDFPVSVVIVQHMDPNHASMLATILARHTPLHVKEAEQDDMLVPGTVYIAPPNRHLLVNTPGRLALSQTKLVHF